MDLGLVVPPENSIRLQDCAPDASFRLYSERGSCATESGPRSFGMHLVLHLLRLVRALATDRTRLALESLALRQQLAVLKRSVERPKLNDDDRLFSTMACEFLDRWKDHLVIVKPDTVKHPYCWTAWQLWGLGDQAHQIQWKRLRSSVIAGDATTPFTVTTDGRRPNSRPVTQRSLTQRARTCVNAPVLCHRLNSQM